MHHWLRVNARRREPSGSISLAMFSVVASAQSGAPVSWTRPHWCPHSWRYVSATRTNAARALERSLTISARCRYVFVGWLQVESTSTRRPKSVLPAPKELLFVGHAL